jgi:hypothetical protein
VIWRLSGLALIIAVTAACPATSSGLSNAAASSPAATVSAENDLGTLTVDQALMYRDGGTIVVKGKLSGGTEVKVRMDGAIGSETRGVFFITIGDGAERRLERQEAAAIIAAVERAMGSLDPRVTQQFVDKLKIFRDGG